MWWLVLAQQPVKPEPVLRGEFVVEVAGKQNTVEIDKPISVTLPSGEKISVVLKRKTVLHFADDAVQFDYPSVMNVKLHNSDQGRMLEIEHKGHPIGWIIPLEPDQMTPEQTTKWYSDEYRNDHPEVFKYSKKAIPIKRTIAGSQRLGLVTDYPYAGSIYRSETYVFKLGKGNVAVLWQFYARDNDEERAMITQISNSLKAADPAKLTRALTAPR